MNSKSLAVFAASMQWADAVKALSRGTPRSQTSVTWGIRWSLSAAEKDGESGGRFPMVRHVHLLGLIGRSHFPAGSWTHHFHVICKTESRTSESGGKMIYL